VARRVLGSRSGRTIAPLCLLVLALGCGGIDEARILDDDDATDDGGWSPDGDPEDGDDTPTVVGDMAAEMTLSELVPTVAVVEWSTGGRDVTRTYLEIGPTPAYGLTFEGEAVGEDLFRAAALGLKPATVYHWRVVAVTDAGPVGTANAFFATGAAPSGLATITLGAHDAEQASGGYVVTSLVGVPATTVILDEDGDYVWWYRHEEGDFKVIRARISRDGEWMFLLVEDVGDEPLPAEAQLVRVRLDGSEVLVQPLVDVRQDFVELPDGTLLFLAYDVWTVDGEEVLGDAVVEVGEDGDASMIWSVWENAAYDPALADLVGESWAHANALQYDDESGLVLVSLRNLHSIHAIDRESGDVRWRMGGDESDFKAESGVTRLFEEQHQFHLTGDRLVVFDNGTAEHACSRVVELTLDAGSEIVEETWTHEADPCLFVYALGDVRRLTDGNTLITWSTAGQMDLVAPDGDVVWRLNCGFGHAFAYAQWVQTLGGEAAP